MTPSLTSIPAAAATAPAAPAAPANPRAAPPTTVQQIDKAARPAVEVAPAKPVPIVVPQKTSVDLEEGIQKMEEIVERMNQEMQAQQRGLSFSYDRTINTHVVTVKSASSGEVIRQIPNEVVVRVAHNLEKLKGLLFDDTY